MRAVLELFSRQIVQELSDTGREPPQVLVIGSVGGSSVAEPAIQGFRTLGWSARAHDPAQRLEFLSLPKESLDGLFVEALPEGWDGERVQRLLATGFQGLRPRGVLFLGFRDHEPTAVLAWLRQAGFEALQQGESAGLQGVLARRIGAVSA